MVAVAHHTIVRSPASAGGEPGAQSNEIRHHGSSPGPRMWSAVRTAPSPVPGWRKTCRATASKISPILRWPFTVS
jgi:hypothetical protein